MAKNDKTTTVRDATQTLVNKVWSFCHILRDDGVGASEYLEQLTYLLFLKMADELGKEIPAAYSWPVLRTKSGSELGEFYTELLNNLAKQPGMVGQIFYQAKSSINKPATLAQIVSMIDQQTWTGLDSDLKGNLYEEILEKTASDKKSGAGQYFTPRALIEAIVECVRPEPGKTICDPACGTGGFFLKAYAWIVKNHGAELNIDQKRVLKRETFFGNEIVPTTRRLCLMNMYLHNIGELDGQASISLADALIADTGARFDYVITNPPFGKKTAQTITNDEGEEEKERVVYNRQDFWTTTSNKQLNFVQHIHTILKTTGRAAVVLPDNVLFEGGAGETIRRKLMETCDLHTILRLPTGVFYAQGVKANVLFFDARPASREAQTREVWVYDYRTNVHHTLKQNPLKKSDLQDFIDCYNPENRYKRTETWSEATPEGRWRKFTYEEILARPKTNLDFKWLKDDTVTPDDYTLADTISTVSERISLIVSAVNEIRSLERVVNEDGVSSVDLKSMSYEKIVTCISAKILDLAIRGKLVVQDPNDEPAEELLARIRDEKAKLIKAKAIKKEKPLPPIADDEKPFDLPKGWSWCRLGELIRVISGVSYKKDDVTTSGIRILRGGNIKEDACICLQSDDVFLPEKYCDDETTINAGDIVVVASTGSSTVIGRPAVAKETMPKVQIGAFLRIVRAINDDCFAWLAIVFRGEYYRQYIREISKGTNINNLKAEYLHELIIPLPPLAEQKRIVAKVEAMLAACEKLKGAGA